MDKVYIQNIELYAKIGADHEKQDESKRYLINLEMDLELHQTDYTDKPDYSVDADEVIDYIREYYTDFSCTLPETVADKMCKYLLNEFYNTEQIKLTIIRPMDMSSEHAKASAVEIIRGWHDAYILAVSDEEVNSLTSMFEELHEYSLECIMCQFSNAQRFENDRSRMCRVFKIITLQTPLEMNSTVAKFNEGLKDKNIDMSLKLIYYDDVMLFHENEIELPSLTAHKSAEINRCMYDINPYYIHPVLKQSMAQLVNKL